jgi:rare lipoprotein A
MRSRRTMRRSRLVRMAAGALMLTIPTSAVALAVGQANAQGAIQINVSSDHVGFGQHVTVTGTAPSNSAGQSVLLEFARSGATSWQTLGSTRIGGDGRFRFIAPLRKSGLLRAVAAGAVSTSRAAGPHALDTAPGAVPPSSPFQVSVGSRFQIRRRSIDVLEGQSIDVRGKLLPGLAGRFVRLEGRSGGGWHTLGSARTGSHGGFQIRYRPGSGVGGAAGTRLRVQFRGDRVNTRSGSAAGSAIVFTESLASWYDDGGSTACGFHAGFGVANRVLPCGTRVTFHYGGHTVTAVVDDRGPYVGGREWDLNQNTAAALGFGGVGTVWSTS